MNGTRAAPSDEGFFTDAIHARLNNQRPHGTPKSSLGKLTQLIQSRLRPDRPGGHEDYRTDFPAITRMQENLFSVALSNQMPVIRNQDETELHILLQSQLRRVGAIGPETGDSIGIATARRAVGFQATPNTAQSSPLQQVENNQGIPSQAAPIIAQESPRGPRISPADSETEEAANRSRAASPPPAQEETAGTGYTPQDSNGVSAADVGTARLEEEPGPSSPSRDGGAIEDLIDLGTARSAVKNQTAQITEQPIPIQQVENNQGVPSQPAPLIAQEVPSARWISPAEYESMQAANRDGAVPADTGIGVGLNVRTTRQAESGPRPPSPSAVSTPPTPSTPSTPAEPNIQAPLDPEVVASAPTESSIMDQDASIGASHRDNTSLAGTGVHQVLVDAGKPAGHDADTGIKLENAFLGGIEATIYNSQSVNLKDIGDSLHGKTHYLKGISGANSDCWWRGGWAAAILQYAKAPEKLETLLINLLGPDYARQASDVRIMAEACGGGKIHNLFMGMSKNWTLEKMAETDNRLMLHTKDAPGGVEKYPENGCDTEGEKSLRELTGAILEKAGVDKSSSNYELSLAKGARESADYMLVEVLLNQLKVDAAVFSLPWKKSSGPREANYSEASVRICKFDNASEDSLPLQSASNEGERTKALIKVLAPIPTLEIHTGHFNLCIPTGLVKLSSFWRNFGR